MIHHQVPRDRLGCLDPAILLNHCQRQIDTDGDTGGWFSTMLELEPRPGRILDALTYARAHLGERISVEQLTDVARISPRQFARQFTAETGATPARTIERLRCEAALPRIEATTEPLDQIAFQVGIGDLDRMRKVCIRIFGQPPQALRRRCRAERNMGPASASHDATT